MSMAEYLKILFMRWQICRLMETLTAIILSTF